MELAVVNTEAEKGLTDSMETACVSSANGFVKDVFHRHHAWLIRLLSARLGRKDEAADVAQEVYLRLVRYDGTAAIRSPQAFLYKVATNVLRDRQRHQAVRAGNRHLPLSDVDEAAYADERLDPEGALISKQRVRFLGRVLCELNPKCQRALVLHRFEKLSHKEIAGLMGVSTSMVEKHISQALSHFRKRLKAVR